MLDSSHHDIENMNRPTIVGILSKNYLTRFSANWINCMEYLWNHKGFNKLTMFVPNESKTNVQKLASGCFVHIHFGIVRFDHFSRWNELNRWKRDRSSVNAYLPVTTVRCKRTHFVSFFKCWARVAVLSLVAASKCAICLNVGMFDAKIIQKSTVSSRSFSEIAAPSVN